MYFVYLLYNETTKKFYVGVTQNIEKRLIEHVAGKNQSTKYCCKDRKLVYYEYYNHKSDAYTREKKLKHHGKGFISLSPGLAIH
ncbi:MAG: GIY-YIG nuclease family protein [candidate division SR1 bacterium]|nr:GIY-YIG nuclease family protein [candidate division SR1 bacterium]